MYGDGQGRPIREHSRRIVVVGAGAAGILSARALLRAGHPSVVLVERNSSWAPGPAYSTSDREHLLNVPASRLSVDSDSPNDFVEWASTRGCCADESSFLPRSLYGEYLQDALCRVERCAPGRLTRVTGDAVGVARETHGRHRRAGVVVGLGDGTSIGAAHVVLALGNPPSRPLSGSSPAIVDDPWSILTQRVEPDDSVVLVGSGLTAVDIALSFAARRHRGPIRMVSRRGLLPRCHEVGPVSPVAPTEFASIPSARTLLAAVRGAIVDVDGDWRAVFDAIRHDTNDLWARLPEPERARLLRHAARYWEVHRHRMAPEVAASIGALVSSGRVELRAAAVVGIGCSADGITRVTVRDARTGTSELATKWVVNCTGPDFDLGRADSPLVRSLLARRSARPGPLGLGLDVTADGALVDDAGRASPAISLVGPLRRGVEWETTAIPDIRRQVEALAPRLVGDHLRERRAAATSEHVAPTRDIGPRWRVAEPG